MILENNIFLIILICVIIILNIGCKQNMRKQFAIEGFEDDISWDGSVNRKYKEIINNEYLYCRGRVLYLRDAPGTSFSSLYLENRSPIKKITIHNIIWQFIYKNKVIENIDKTPIYRFYNRPLPVVLEPMKMSKDIDYRLSYDFMSKENANDFKIGDKIRVNIEVTYEVDAKMITEGKDFMIVCIWVNRIHYGNIY